MLGTDSHTTSAGAFGQFATGVGNTDAAFILGTGKILLKASQNISSFNKMWKHLNIWGCFHSSISIDNSIIVSMASMSELILSDKQ